LPTCAGRSGFLCLLVANLAKAKWPGRRDWLAVVALGVCFFGLFFVLHNTAMAYTTAARASLALSTLPLQTMVIGAPLGIERLTLRKSLGVAIAMFGVLAALAAGLAAAPQRAWLGELIMAAAILAMAHYNIFARPYPKIEPARVLGRRHGRRRARLAARGTGNAPLRHPRPFRRSAVARRGLSRCERGRCGLHSLGALRRRAWPTP
jgi:drug/metabolite transporter (DMT)-like permease